MRKYTLSFIFLLSVIFSLSAQQSKGYDLSFTIDSIPDSVAYLAYYYGEGQFYRDTAKIDKKGHFEFKDPTDTLEYGMYSIIANRKKLFDFIVDGQKFSAQTTMNNTIPAMKFEGSPENTAFYLYLRYLKVQQTKAKDLESQLKASKDTAQIIQLQSQLKELDNEVSDYLSNFHKKYEGTLASNFILALKFPIVPPAPKDENGQIDSSYALRYFKTHFFDDFDFCDSRLVRTPTFHDKIVYYLDKLTYQNPDSINKSIDYILDQAKFNDAQYKYALSFMTSRYERSNKMGMDAVFVHLVLDYFAKGKADDWYGKQELKKLVDKATTLEPLLIGHKAPNIIVKDTSQTKILQLKDIDAKYTIVYIWSATCGHCKIATPQLLKLYHQYKDQGLEVFAINDEMENKEWLEYIQEHHLDFINGADGGDFRSNFRELYDVFSTPTTYLLDKDKVIVAKQMSMESLGDMLEFYINNNKKGKETKKSEK